MEEIDASSDDPPLTLWIERLREGDDLAAERLWTLYFRRMAAVAERKLEGAPKRLADEEDVAASAFKSFCLGAQRGRFPQLSDRHGLWPLLVAIVANKSVDHVRRENRKKRGGQGAGEGRVTVADYLDDVAAPEPTPEFAVEIADEFERLMESLDATDDPQLKTVALARMNGDTVPEIAERLGVTRRTIERKIAVVRRLWEKRLA